MTASSDTDYVLGTHRDEIRRLEIQHRLWSRHAQQTWDRAGISAGSRVLDLGSGPGFATRELAERVGPGGAVYGFERSANFLEFARSQPASPTAGPIRYLEGDIMRDALPDVELDRVWCRLVACFVNSPEKLVAKLSGALQKGGKVIFHEFFTYDTWRFLGRYPAMDAFVSLVMKSWTDTGGDPHIAQRLPALLADAGFRLTHAQPYLFCLSPSDGMWEWPDSFIRTNLKRLVELGLANAAFEEAALQEYERAAALPETRMMTPVLMELIAEKL